MREKQVDEKWAEEKIFQMRFMWINGLNDTRLSLPKRRETQL